MLEIQALTKRFDDLIALDQIDLSVGHGDILGLIGPNGSGKTTLLNLVTGVYPPSAGKICVANTDLVGLRAHQIANLGVARTFQNIRLFLRMTVFDNVWVAQHRQSNGSVFDLFARSRSSDAALKTEVDAALGYVGLEHFRDTLASELPLPARRKLEIARALAADPDLILLDEPAGGMTPSETAEIATLIQDVVAPGRTCIVIEHKMDMITQVCSRICVLNHGRKIADGPPDQIFQNQSVLEAYLGPEDEIGDA